MDTFGRCAVELLTRYHLTVCIETMSYLEAYGCGCRLDGSLVDIVGPEWIHVSAIAVIMAVAAIIKSLLTQIVY
jgi:hypothetical protein